MIASILSISIPATVIVVTIDYLMFRCSRRKAERWIDRIESEIVK